MGQQVKGVLLDVGEVLVSLDGFPALSKLLNSSVSRPEMTRRWGDCSAVQLFETGLLSTSEFATRTVAELGLPLTAEEFVDECHRWLGAPLKGACDLVERIPLTHRVAVLSNMGPLHWERAEVDLPARIERSFVSWQIGVMKPAPQAFEIALRWFDLPPAEVLFLDDSPRNVEAAVALGMNARVVTDAHDMETALRDFGVLVP